MPVVPAKPVTPPVADALSMMPALNPTRPPPVPFEPTAMLPPAKEPVTVPKFCPTSPPAETFWQELLAAQFGSVWMTVALEVTVPLAEEVVMVEPGELNPASPPRLVLMPLSPLTLPLAEEDAIDPEPELKRPFSPTSPPSKLAAPPATLPLADEPVMLPRLMPTSPPAILKAVAKLPFPTLTFAAELEFSIRPLFCATRPPASAPAINVPLTLPLST